MGTTVHSSFDFSSILPWLGRRQGTDPSEANRSSLEHPSAVREFLRCRPVPAGGSREFLEGICKSAAAQVAAVGAIVQEQILTRRFPERAVQLPEQLNTQQVAVWLYGTYMLPFEIASLLLLVAIVGAVVMAKKRI